VSPSGWQRDTREFVDSGDVGDLRLTAETESLTVGEHVIGTGRWGSGAEHQHGILRDAGRTSTLRSSA
jgi:hypothetical protein